MVGDFTCKLSKKELEHYLNAYIVLERVNPEDYRSKDRIRLYGISLPLADSYIYEIGETLGHFYYRHNEIVINHKAPRVELIQDPRKQVFFTLDELKKLELSGSTYIPPCYKNKGILKLHRDSVATPKIVSFDDVVYITPISPVKYSESTSEEEPSSPQTNGDNDDDSSDDIFFNPYVIRESFYNALNSSPCSRHLFTKNLSALNKTFSDPSVSGECSYRGKKRTLFKHNISEEYPASSSKRFCNSKVKSVNINGKSPNVNGILSECSAFMVNDNSATILSDCSSNNAEGTSIKTKTQASLVKEGSKSGVNANSAHILRRVTRRFRKKKKLVNSIRKKSGNKQLSTGRRVKLSKKQNRIALVDKREKQVVDSNNCVADRKLNGAHMITEEKTESLNSSSEQNPPEKMEFVGIPKRKRGRPKKNNPDPPFNPFAPKKKTYIVPKKIQSPLPDPSVPKRKRGRPKKKVEFGFHSIVSDIKTITLPSDLWSAHVSVTSKRSQVCFTRVVQPVSDTVPVECDRSVKFNGSINYYVKINSRNVELVAAPKTVGSLQDIEILLQIVHDININDPVLRYLTR